jgi:Flp pilus assembly CpaE family ATPase
MIRLLLAGAEDRRNQWEEALREHSGIEIAGAAGSLAELASLVRAVRPHVLLMGLSAGEEEAADLLDALKGLQFRPGIVVAAEENDPEAIRTIIRLQAKDFLPAACGAAEIEAAVKRVYSAAVGQNRDRTGLLLGLWGCRGGAGTTSIALTLAGAARRKGLKVAVADGDIALGDAAFFMNTRPALTWVDWARDSGSGERDIHRYLAATEEGFSILAAPKSPAQSELIRPQAVSEALDLLLKSHDLVIADLHRSFDEITLQFAEKAQRLWLVTDASLAGVKNVSLFWGLLDQLRLGHEERAALINRVSKGTAQTAAKMASLYKASALIPEEPALERAWESGRSPVQALPRSPFVKAVGDLLLRLFPDLSASGKGRKSG